MPVWSREAAETRSLAAVGYALTQVLEHV